MPLSLPDREALLELCNKFINSDEDVTLAQLLDFLHSSIPDHRSEEFIEWSKYMERLNEAWVLIYKEKENISWPEVSAIQLGVGGVTEYRSAIFAIYNHRFNQMMEESSHKIFLLAYYLHPLFRHHGGLQLTMPPLIDGVKPQFPSLFTELLKSLLTIFQGEQLRTQDSGSEVVPELIQQFVSYAYNKEPFHSYEWTRRTKPLKWWIQLSKDSGANLLAKVAIKIFSISPSEICDERTASRLGWFNAARRSSMTPEHLVDSAKLYDFYVNGFMDSTSKHTARIHLSKTTPSTSPNPAVHSAPSLMDLLNTENIIPHETEAMEELWFNNPDPYDLAETDRVDPDLQKVVVRTSTRFDIAKYVKLCDEKLEALLSNVDTAGPGALTTEIAPTQAKSIGNPGEWSVESFL